MEFGGAIHGVVNLSHLVHCTLDVLWYWFKTDDMTIVKDHSSLLVFGVVEGTDLLMT